MELKVFLDAKTALLGFKDENDNIVIPAMYESATDFSEGYAVVEYHKVITGKGENAVNTKKRVIALLDEQGHEIDLFDLGCERALPFENGLCAMKMNNEWILVDKYFRCVTDKKYAFQNFEDLKITDLKVLVDLVDKEGVKVLNWADPVLFVSEDNYNVLKTALKNHLKGLVPKIDINKIESEIEFTNLIQNEYDKFKQIREEKLKQVVREKEINGRFFNMVDEMIK